MDYRMNLWIHVSRYGLQDEPMDLCIQVWIKGWIYGLNVSRYGFRWTYGSMYPGMDYRMDLWIYVSRYRLQDGCMDICIQVWITEWIYGLNVSRYGLQDGPMDLCIQVWITGWIYGSLYPGMNFRMDRWIHMYPGMDYRMNLWIYVSRYGLQDGSMDLCIQVKRTVWSLLLRLEGGYKQLQSSLNIHRRLVSTPNQSSRSDLSPELHLTQLQVLHRQPRTLFFISTLLRDVGEGIGEGIW